MNTLLFKRLCDLENRKRKRPTVQNRSSHYFAHVFHKQMEIEAAPNLSLRSTESNIALMGTMDIVYLFELSGFSMNEEVTSPYTVYRAIIRENEPISRLIYEIQLDKIYGTCSATERQQLALDPLYVLSSSRKPLKARALIVDWVPWYGSINHYCIILTSLGDCRLYSRDSMQSHFLPFKSNLNSTLFEIIPKYEIPASEISTYDEFATYVNRYYITTFCCHPLHPFIYLATAAGIIVCLEFNPDNGHVKPIFYYSTDLGYITYIMIYDTYMILGNILGVLQLFKLNINELNHNIHPLLSLWREHDRIPCRKVLISPIENGNSFIIVFYKSSTIIAMVVTKLDLRNNCQCHTYRVRDIGTHLLNGIKISGK